MKRGRFITLEGVDGAGKTTQRAWLERRLRDRGLPLLVTREPGGTPLGEQLRGILLDGSARAHPETETLLIFAARREHIHGVIAPALEAGSWVICDRFTDATFAYQCGGSGVQWEKVAALEAWVHAGLQPDLTLLFDVDPRIGLSRARQLKQPDRFEAEALGFHERVRLAYLRRAAEHPERIRVVDASVGAPEVQKELEKILLNV